MLIDHKQKNYRKRPNKELLSSESYERLKNFNGGNIVRLSDKIGEPPGLIVVRYKLNEIDRVYGTYLPIEVLPFTANNNILD